MKPVLLLMVLTILATAQADPVVEAYKAWDLELGPSEFHSRAQALFGASAKWVAQWPESRFAWERRREALMNLRSQSSEAWKEVGENLIRLYPPHAYALSAADDWVAQKVNLKEAEALIASEMQWRKSQPGPSRPTQPSLADLIAEAESNASGFFPLCTLASAQIQLKEFESARSTLRELKLWLDGVFRNVFDQDPLETFPDYESKYYILSAQLAQAEGRTMDALAFFQHVITNPYFRREYGGYVKETRELWKQSGGTEEGWALFSSVPAMPKGVPTGYPGTSFAPWLTLDYKLPEMKALGLDSRIWTTKDFEGKTTFVYLWAAWCGPCWMQLPAVQSIYNAIKDRHDIQVVTVSVDEDREKLIAFMKEKGYNFPVIVSKAYVEKLLPQIVLGQDFIVDRSAAIRLQQRTNFVIGREQAFVDDKIYKLTQVAKGHSAP